MEDLEMFMKRMEQQSRQGLPRAERRRRQKALDKEFEQSQKIRRDGLRRKK